MIEENKKRKRTRKSIAKTEKKEKAPAIGGEKTTSKIQKSKQQTKKTGQKSRNCKKERTADQKTKDI